MDSSPPRPELLRSWPFRRATAVGCRLRPPVAFSLAYASCFTFSSAAVVAAAEAGKAAAAAAAAATDHSSEVVLQRSFASLAQSFDTWRVFVAAIVVLVLWACHLAYDRFVGRPRRTIAALRAQGIPGFEFRPLVGQLPDMAKERKQRETDAEYAAVQPGGSFFFKHSKEFGPVWHFSFGPYPRLFLADPDLIRRAYNTRHKDFRKSRFLRSIRLFGNGLVVSEGELWSRQRRLIAPSFTHKEIKRIYSTILLCAEEAVDRWEATIMTAAAGEVAAAAAEEARAATAQPPPQAMTRSLVLEGKSGPLTAAGAKAAATAAATSTNLKATTESPLTQQAPAKLMMNVEFAKLTLEVICRAAFGMQLQGNILLEESLERLVRSFTQYFVWNVKAQRISAVVPFGRYLPLEANRQDAYHEGVIRDSMRQIFDARIKSRREKGAARPEEAEVEKEEAAGRESQRTDLLELMLNATLTEGDMEGELAAQQGGDAVAAAVQQQQGSGSSSSGSGGGSSSSSGNSGMWGRSSSSSSMSKAGVRSDAVTNGGVSGKGGSKVGLTSPLMSEQQLMDECLTFLVGGHETTAILLTWTMVLLSQHPEYQDRVRAEVFSVLCPNWIGKSASEGSGSGSEDCRSSTSSSSSLGGDGASFKSGTNDQSHASSPTPSDAPTRIPAPTYEQLQEMKLLGSVLNEALRLYPPVFYTTRTCVESCQLSESVTVPRGCDIMVGIGVMHRDKTLWGDDAEEFRPERFLESGSGGASAATAAATSGSGVESGGRAGGSEGGGSGYGGGGAAGGSSGGAGGSRHPAAFIPFGIGPRVCVGRNLALTEAKAVMALLLSRFSWTLAPEYVHHPELTITLKPKFGTPVLLTRLQWRLS